MSNLDLRVKELKNLLFEEAKKHSIYDPINCVPKESYNEVLENCFLGDYKLATNKELLKNLGITHVLNAAKGEKLSQIFTNQTYYNELNIKFCGFNLMDVDSCQIEAHFSKATEFIHSALNQENGKIFIHCYMGVSRSASFILAYLIKYKQIKLDEAIRMLFSKRLIWPNDGFLLKLILYEQENLK